MPLTKAPSSNSFSIKPNSSGLNYSFQKFTDFLDGGETGTNTASVYLGDNGTIIESRFITTGARTGNDSTYSPSAQLEPAIGVRFIRTATTINSRGHLGIQHSGTVPPHYDSTVLYSLRCAFSSVSSVVFRMGTSGSWTSDLWASTDSVGFELDTSVLANFQALKGTSAGAIVREDTGIVASASKTYIFSVQLITATSYRYRIFEQTGANVAPTSVYDQTLTVSNQNDWAFQFGIKTLANAEKVLYLDWFLAKYASEMTPALNNIRFPFTF